MDKNKRGLHNWRNLFNKPSFQDWMVLFMLIMVLFMVWAYQYDIGACKAMLDECREQCYVVKVNPMNKLNISDFVVEIKNGTKT